MKKIIPLLVCIFLNIPANAQVFTNKEVGEKNQALIDSLKTTEYPYALPIWGDKATKAGFNLPYSAGFSTQYLWQESDLIIDNLKVGFNNGTLYNLDQVVRFDKAKATTNSVTVRPDIWLFPFLNIYGIFGKSNASTAVGFGVWVPDPGSNTETQILHMDTKIDFNATTVGIGMTPTIGVGGGFLALDMNCSWTDIPQLDKPAFGFVFGPRLGKNFKLAKPNKAVAIWVGGFRFKLNSETNGSIPLGDVLPISEWETRLASGNEKLNNAQQQVDNWWQSTNQSNPVNIAKHNAAIAALNRAGEIIGAAEIAVGNASNSTVQYSMDKRPKDMWNFIVGSQYQFSKHWMARAEVGFLGSRTQVLTGLQYRFGL